jgi:hypothetical protein
MGKEIERSIKKRIRKSRKNLKKIIRTLLTSKWSKNNSFSKTQFIYASRYFYS